MNGATGIQVLADQSGKADANRNLTQLTASAQPILVASNAAYNGQPTATLDGARFLRTTPWVAPPVQPYRYYWVGNLTILSGNQAIVDGLASTAASLMYTSTANFRMDSGASFQTSGTAMTSKVIAVADWNRASSKYGFSAKTLTATGMDVGAKNNLGITLGAYADGGIFMTGTFAELLITSGAVSAADHGAIMDYFGTKYAITVAA